ncbi:uncharacterized protein LOC110722464 [Chenopodium quinoa]|uniref:uncharacterized protein LOC110722464 n=1 Tax=Chenopodium quinoa TaxID=63459 RepID=UPI000B794412|nr:uncharacterized protein LOC110722464 [Chenopodium quinoa]
MEHVGEKRKNSDSFHGGEKRHNPNSNNHGNFGYRRDNKGIFGKGNGGQSSNARGNGNQGGERPKRKYICRRCEKDHLGKDCEGKPVTCRYCQKLGHREYECYKKEVDVKSGRVKESSVPSKPSQPSGPTPKVGTSSVAGGAPKGRVFVMNSREAETVNDVVIGVFLTKFPPNLIEFDLRDLDVILGMEWLGRYEAKIDNASKKDTLTSPSKTRVVYKKEGKSSGLRITSAMQLQKIVKKGCSLFLCNVQEIESEEKKGDGSIPVVEEFPDVFPNEIPGMPPVRDVEFTIDLVSST